MMKKRWFQGLIALILGFLLLLLISAADFIFEPIFTYVGAVSIPVIGAGLLFYITRPVMHLFEKMKINRVVAILLVFVLLLLLLYVVARYLMPILQTQFHNLVHNIPAMVAAVQDLVSYIQANQNVIPDEVSNAINDLTSDLQTYIESAMSFLVSFISEFIGILLAVVLIPFFLFFMLKDGEKFVPFVTQFFKKKKAANLRALFHKIDETLTSYIMGQLVVAFCIGVMLYIGYVLIGLKYALTLALFGMILSVIPFLGAYIGVAPGMLVGLFQDPLMPIWVALVMLIAQQIESNLISPNVIGKVLHLHPLTVITLVLAAGSIAGFFGMLFVIPIYTVVKTIISHFYETYQDEHKDDDAALL